MNTRVLELIKNPELFQHKDLDLLDSEIKQHSYVQVFRALHLFGTHHFNPENYQPKLSKTAAYTTDKKILYQFINKRNVSEEITKKVEKQIVEDNIRETKELQEKTFQNIDLQQVEIPKQVFVNGELNRILFEGEEDFLERKQEIIDIESTLESGEIVTQTTEIQEFKNNIEKKQIENLEPEEDSTHETVVEEIQIAETKPVVEHSELSFHATEEFLPEVKVKANDAKPESYEVPKPQLSKHEQEMQRLIAEVEAKMKISKKEKTKSEENTPQNTDVNFSETQTFEVPKTEEIEIPQKENVEKTLSEENQKIENNEEKSLISVQKEEKSTKISPKSTETKKTEWKPMGFVSNIPDSLINKKSDLQTIEKETKTETPKQEITEQKTEERPVFNVSFFTQKVSPIETEKTQEQEKNSENIVENSNIPTFINTWQNWLKIDRTTQVSKEEVKTKAIENFIENEPKISKLKEDSEFIVKEKSNDISHLMTETLAKLYLEQKLYSKAIKAYEVLAEKHPEKEQKFTDKILEIKELRKNT